MSQRRFADAARLLHDLLDRHEARPGRERLLAYVDEAQFLSVAEEAACFAQLEAAERVGAVIVARRRSDGVERILHVRLAGPDILYGLLGRTPAVRQAETALSKVFENAPVELEAIRAEVLNAWGRKVGRFGLRPGASDALQNALALVGALQARASSLSVVEIDFRSFPALLSATAKRLSVSSHLWCSCCGACRQLRCPTVSTISRYWPPWE